MPWKVSPLGLKAAASTASDGARCRSTAAGLVATAGFARRSDRIEIIVDAAQQADQHLPFVLAKAGEQAPLALKRGDNHVVMCCVPLERQRDRMRSRVLA